MNGRLLHWRAGRGRAGRNRARGLLAALAALGLLAVLAWPGVAAASTSFAGLSFGSVEVPEGSVQEGDIRLSMGEVVVRGQVTGSVHVSLGHVEVMPTGRVDGDVDVTLGGLALDGEVGGSASSLGGDVEVSGRVGGDVAVEWGEVKLGRGADVRGEVSVAQGHVTTEPGARVAGGVNEESRRAFAAFSDRGRPARFLSPFRFPLRGWPFPGGAAGWVYPGGVMGWLWRWLGSVGHLVAGLALGVVLYALFPLATERAGRALRRHPGWVALVGLGSALAFPLAVLVLVITLVGILAVPLLVLGVVGAALFGHVVAGLVLGRLVRGAGHEPSRHLPYVDIIIGVALIWALGQVPIAGWMLLAAVSLFGLGVAVSTAFGAFEPWFLRWGRRGQPGAGGATGP